MEITFYSFLLPGIAGLSTLIGIIPIFIKVNNIDKLIIKCFSFATGVMLTISFIDLIPESFILINNYFCKIPAILLLLIFFTIGNLISLYLDKKIEKGNSDSLYKIGFISMLAIIIHNILEGMVTFISTTSNFKLGISITISIIFHNIPEGIIIAVPLYYASKKKGRAVILTAISALSELIGSVIAFLFLSKYLNNLILGILYALTAGIMFNIVISELIPYIKKYKNYILSITYIILGITLCLIVHLLLN